MYEEKKKRNSDKIVKKYTNLSQISGREQMANPAFPWQQRHLPGETCPKTGRQVWRIASLDINNGKKTMRW
jgi:hypothetical protein